MADILPTASAQQLTPRTPDLTDTVFETRRIADAQMRSNPLRNAKIDDGRMEWRGNYAGGGLGGKFLWIGEFNPADPNMGGRPQRGFILTRDDPKHAAAFWMYDPWATPSVPLRQIVLIRDADGRPIMSESRVGGTQFPWSVIPMNQAQSDNPGNGATYRSAINGAQAGVWRPLYQGAGPVTGTHSRVRCFFTSTAGQTMSVRIRHTWSDNTVTLTSPIAVVSNGNITIDTNFEGLDRVGLGVTMVIEANITAGVTDLTWLYCIEASMYSP